MMRTTRMIEDGGAGGDGRQWRRTEGSHDPLTRDGLGTHIKNELNLFFLIILI
jgi:hypothetical protein